MPLETYKVEGFGGLNEIDNLDEIGIENAAALSNVDWDNTRGAIRQRWGVDDPTDGSYTTAATQIFPTVGSTLFHENGTLKKISLGSLTGDTLVGTGYKEAVNFGTPSTSYTYIADSGNGIARFEAPSTVTQPANMPKARHLGVTSDFRLAAANTTSSGGPSAATSSTSHIWFSDPGLPETWNSNNYVILRPGDGEAIRAVCSWQNQLFVFKSTALFIFYSTTTDAAGNPVFNYRTVHLEPNQALTQTADDTGGVKAYATAGGVFFAGADGLYLTTGDTPILVSDRIDLPPSDGTGGSIQVYYTRDRVYYVDPEYSAGAGRVTIYDTRVGEWTRWDMPIQTMSPSSYSYPDDFYFTRTSTGFRYYSGDGTYTTDNGTNISSYWASGFSNLGYESEKRLKYIDVWGTGTVGLSVATDYGSGTANSGFPTATTLTLGATSAIKKARYAVAANGTLFAIKFSSVSGAAWKVHRVVLHFEADSDEQHFRTP